MFKEHLSNLSNDQLKKRNRFCLGIAIGFLLGMIGAIVFSLMQISNQDDSAIWWSLGPGIAMPLLFIPLGYASVLSTEIKKRKNQ